MLQFVSHKLLLLLSLAQHKSVTRSGKMGQEQYGQDTFREFSTDRRQNQGWFNSASLCSTIGTRASRDHTS